MFSFEAWSRCANSICSRSCIRALKEAPSIKAHDSKSLLGRPLRCIPITTCHAQISNCYKTSKHTYISGTPEVVNPWPAPFQFSRFPAKHPCSGKKRENFGILDFHRFCLSRIYFCRNKFWMSWTHVRPTKNWEMTGDQVWKCTTQDYTYRIWQYKWSTYLYQAVLWSFLMIKSYCFT